jgi:hypothetical protein
MATCDNSSVMAAMAWLSAVAGVSCLPPVYCASERHKAGMAAIKQRKCNAVADHCQALKLSACCSDVIAIGADMATGSADIAHQPSIGIAMARTANAPACIQSCVAVEGFVKMANSSRALPNSVTLEDVDTDVAVTP